MAAAAVAAVVPRSRRTDGRTDGRDRRSHARRYTQYASAAHSKSTHARTTTTFFCSTESTTEEHTRAREESTGRPWLELFPMRWKIVSRLIYPRFFFYPSSHFLSHFGTTIPSAVVVVAVLHQPTHQSSNHYQDCQDSISLYNTDSQHIRKMGKSSPFKIQEKKREIFLQKTHTHKRGVKHPLVGMPSQDNEARSGGVVVLIGRVYWCGMLRLCANVR